RERGRDCVVDGGANWMGKHQAEPFFVQAISRTGFRSVISFVCGHDLVRAGSRQACHRLEFLTPRDQPDLRRRLPLMSSLLTCRLQQWLVLPVSTASISSLWRLDLWESPRRRNPRSHLFSPPDLQVVRLLAAASLSKKVSARVLRFAAPQSGSSSLRSP